MYDTPDEIWDTIFKYVILVTLTFLTKTFWIIKDTKKYNA